MKNPDNEDSKELDEDGNYKPIWRVKQEKNLSILLPILSNKELFEKTFDLTEGSQDNDEPGRNTFTYGDWVNYNAYRKELERRLSFWLK